MTLQEVFRECARLEDFPQVQIDKPVRHANTNVGKIVEINTRGLAVHFPDMKWNTWFTWEEGTDRRSHYARELTLFKEPTL